MRKALIVEDHKDTLRLLALMTETIPGWKVQQASDFESAMTAAKTGHYDLLISDLMLPDACGIDLLHEVRKLHPSIKGIAITGYGADGEDHQTKAAGFKAHLTKPVELWQLTEAVESVTGVKEPVPRA